MYNHRLLSAISSIILVVTLIILKTTLSFSIMILIISINIFIVVILNSDTINKYLLDYIYRRDITNINHMGTKSFKKVLFLRNLKKLFSESLLLDNVLDLFNWNVNNKIAFTGLSSIKNRNSIMLDKTLRLDVCYFKTFKEELIEGLNRKSGNGPLTKNHHIIDLCHKDLFFANSCTDSNIDRLKADIATPREYRPIWGPWTAQDRAIDYRCKFWLLNIKIDDLVVLNKYKTRADLYFEINELRADTSLEGEGDRKRRASYLLTKLRKYEEDIFYNHHESKYGIDWFFGSREGKKLYWVRIAKSYKACRKKNLALYEMRTSRFSKDNEE